MKNLPTHLSSAAVAESLLREAAAALDVILPLDEGRELGLQDLLPKKWKTYREKRHKK